MLQLKQEQTQYPADVFIANVVIEISGLLAVILPSVHKWLIINWRQYYRNQSADKGFFKPAVVIFILISDRQVLSYYLFSDKVANKHEKQQRNNKDEIPDKCFYTFLFFPSI